MTEATLIERAREGEHGAIETLYRRHAPRVYALVRRLAGGDDALAEDWSQEAWIQAIRALPGFRGEARFGTWLYRIAANAALQGLRGRERRAGRELPLPEAVPAAVNGAPLLRVRLERALGALPPGMRQVLVLHDVEGYTHEEMAEMLGVSAGTCKSQLFKARARMRMLLGGTPQSSPGEEVCSI